MSYPVSNIELGNNNLYSGFSKSGQPAQEKGKRADENQVSKTSSSYIN